MIHAATRRTDSLSIMEMRGGRVADVQATALPIRKNGGRFVGWAIPQASPACKAQNQTDNEPAKRCCHVRKIDDGEWAAFEEQGFLRLGRVLEP
ncbi:MAG TPA: hypothetical protein VHC49_04435, partial [Mycobacteriales bacterium]|nr:hypothetical protein [Mycobacteriales bacterium]